MAGRFGILNTSTGITTGTTAKTILALTAPANHGVRIKEIEITFEGTSPTAAKIPLRFIRGASGAGTGTSRTPASWGANNPTGSIQATGKENYSSNPTGGTMSKDISVHPQGGYSWRGEIILNPAEVFEIQTEAASAVNARAGIIFEE